MKFLAMFARVHPPAGIRLEHHLSRDLGIGQDVYLQEVVPALGRFFQIEPSRQDLDITTVREHIALVERLLDQRRRRPDASA